MAHIMRIDEMSKRYDLISKLENIVKNNSEWVDMGGTVLWKNTNEPELQQKKGYEPYYGSTITYDMAMRRYKKEDLPTKSNFEELMKCNSIWGKFEFDYVEWDGEKTIIERYGRYFYTNDFRGVLFLPADKPYKDEIADYLTTTLTTYTKEGKDAYLFYTFEFRNNDKATGFSATYDIDEPYHADVSVRLIKQK